MKRLAYIVAFVVLIAATGCHNNNEPSPAPEGSLVVENNQSVVRLNHTLDSFTLTFTSSCNWHIKSSGKQFTVSPTKGSGSAEPQTITITALSENVSDAAVVRGSLEICLDNYSTKHKVKVMQCAVSERTILAYFFGTSLSYFFGINIDCMKTAISEDILGNNRLIAFIQTSRSEAVIKELYYDTSTQQGEECFIRKIALSESLTGKQFGEYMLNMMQIAPAERYAAIFGGHSTAWLPALNSTGGVPLSVGSTHIPNWTPAPGAEITRTIGENNVRLNIDDLAEGLTATNHKFDWLYFDVCFMSSLEATYALRNNTNYIVASPCEIMGYGSPFDLLLDELVADDLDGACRTYRNYYAYDYYGRKSGCIATTVCAELDALAATVKALNQESIANDLNLLTLQVYEGRSAHLFFDAEHYAYNAYNNDALVKAFSEQLDKTIINRYNTNQYYSTYNSMMNDISHYSGVNFTPDERCLPICKTWVDTWGFDLVIKKRELADFKAELDKQGIPLVESAEYIEMKKQVEILSSNISDMQEQIAELECYHPSLKQTAWYKATH